MVKKGVSQKWATYSYNTVTNKLSCIFVQPHDPSKPDNYSFYWPSVQRAKVDELLKRASDGTFCLRRSRDKNLCLSIKHHTGKERHFIK